MIDLPPLLICVGVYVLVGTFLLFIHHWLKDEEKLDIAQRPQCAGPSIAQHLPAEARAA